LHIFFKDDHFFFIINKTFVLTVDPCFSWTYHFIVALFYELYFLKKYLTYPKLGYHFRRTFLYNFLPFI
jgi:hypothetical protein